MRGGTLIGLAFGLVVGVLISFGVVWYLNKTPLPFIDKGNKTESRTNGKDSQPLALPGKPGDKPVEAKKFDFYDILEGKKSATPGTAPVPPASTSQPPPQPQAKTAEPPPAAGAAPLFLQIGAFQKAGDAENLKARVAMMGFEASVQSVEVPDKGTLHRVRTGPFANPEQMNQVRTQLSQNGIPATVVRVKD